MASTENTLERILSEMARQNDRIVSEMEQQGRQIYDTQRFVWVSITASGFLC
jgi:hypothetical protein